MARELPKTRALLEQGIAEGLHPGAQLHVRMSGETVADFCVGESRPGVPMTLDTINLWMSSVKPVAAVAIAQQWEAGRLDLDDRVERFIPEFGARGKSPITIRHILTHTGGFRAVPRSTGAQTVQEVLALVYDAPLEPRWIPGQTAGYHANEAWYVLAEVVRRIDGRPFEQYVREAIFLPIGMDDCWVGMPPDAYREYGQRIGFIFDASRGEARSPAFDANTPEAAANVKPSANGRGPMRQLAQLYEMLRNQGQLPHRPRLLLPQTVEVMTARHRIGSFDLTFKHVVDWGLGFIINSSQYGSETIPYGYGAHASPRTFGHSGSQSSSAFCDPERQLVVAWHCNGMPGEARDAARQRAINGAIYEDLGVARAQA